MRVLWLSLLVVAASGFEVGKEYVYKYKGTLHVANPEQPLQSSGIAFQSRLVLQPKPDGTHFKIVNFEADSFNSEHIDVAHHEFNFAANENFAGVLEHPFAGKFDEGKLEEFAIGKNEPLFVRNLKKGILSLFQLDLVKGRHEHHDDKEYHVKEDGLHGPCDTLYIVHEEEHGEIEVTKVKNLEKCDHHHYSFYGHEKGKRCLKCKEVATNPHTATSEVYYELKGTAQHYVIDHAWAESDQLFKPHGEGKTFHVILNRTLDLVEEHDAPTTDTTLLEAGEKEHSLAQEFPETHDLKNPEELKHPNRLVAHFGLTPNKEDFVQGLQKLAHIEYTDEDIKEIDNKESGSLLFMMLFHNLLTFSYDDINDVYQNHVLTAPEDIKESIRSIFLDLLAAAGLNPHVTFGLNLIKNNELSVDAADSFYTKLHLNLKEVSPALIQEIADSCKSEAVKSHREIWTSCKLAASAIAGGKGCKHAHDDHEEDHGTCGPEIISHMFNYSVTPSFVEHEPEYVSTVYIRSAGNLGTRKAMHYLERFIYPKWHANEHKRMAALWALKQAAKQHPELARSIALPVFHNTSEPSEIRIASFLVVVVTDPDLFVLRHIGLEVLTDPSDQVVSFVISAFRSLANSKYPCHKQLAQKLQYVLPLWETNQRFRKPIDKASSHLQISSGYNPKFDYGGLTLVEMIRSHDSYLPRNLYITMKDYVAGHSTDTVAFSFESWGLDKLFNRLVGPQPGSTKNLWNFMGRRRFPRDASAKERKEIEDALHIHEREYDPVYARLSLSVFGKAVDSWDFDESIFEAVKTKDAPEKTVEKILGKQLRKKSFYVSQDMTYLHPTELGVPVFFDFKQAEFIYANREKIELTHGDNAEIRLGIKRHYLYETRLQQMVGFAWTYTRSSLGSGYDARTVISWPLDLKATIAPLEGKLSLNRPLHLPWNAMNHHFHPFTFNTPYDLTRSHSNAISEFTAKVKPLYRNDELLEFDRHYFGEIFGVGMNVKGHLIKRGLSQAMHEFYHEMSWRERFYYMQVNPNWHPRSVKLYFEPAGDAPTKEMDIDIAYKFLEPDDERHSHFKVHDQIGEDPEVPSTHVLNIDVNFKGDAKERKVAAELRYSFNHDLFNHKFQFFYERTPFRSDDHEGLKICLAASAKFPHPDWSRVNELATFYQGKHIDANLDIHYGSSCDESQSSIHLHGQYTHTDSDEVQLVNAAAGKPITGNLRWNGLHRMALKCQAGREHGIPFNYYCLKFLRHSSRLAKLTADVEWKNYKPLLNKLFPLHTKYQALRPKHGGFFGVIRSHFTGENGKLHVVSQVPWWDLKEEPHTDMVITTEDGQRFQHWGVPTFSHMLEPRVFSSLGYSNMGEYAKQYKHRYCDLQSLSVRTFDGTLVKLPETDCYKVVSRDCSPNKRFLILARSTNNPSLTKALKVFIHTTKLEILPVTEDSGLIVRVDGNKVDVAPEHPYSHTDHDVELFEVRTREKWFEVISKSYGLYLTFNGNLLFVQTAPFYRGKLCGLCGDYNLDRNHELSGPDGHLYNNTLEFAKSYVVPSPDCHAPAH
ncbi:vitellogenin-6 [Rhipicephalus sanguineus]|uniref:vitellogenin-6 n=1 Tax=Rhipicephalus sanguineus TaxID=34632 RepID=UPI001893667F|nr:vitellogenin-6 [Rhipicephalus sanguineus]